jgi:hypothetical protein
LVFGWRAGPDDLSFMRDEPVDPVPHPASRETWFRKLPPERQVALGREHNERLKRPGELAALERRRMRGEAQQMGGVFALFGDICSGFGFDVLLVSTALGTALGWVCSRLDLFRIPTGAAGMLVFFGSQYWLHGSVWMVLFGTFPLGGCCALIGWTREERGS